MLNGKHPNFPENLLKNCILPRDGSPLFAPEQWKFPNRLFYLPLSSLSSAQTAENNRPRSIYQYSNMGPRLSGLTSIFGVVFFVSKSPLGIEGQKKLEKFAILTRKPRSHA